AILTVQDGDYPARDESLLAEIPPGLPVHRTPILEPYSIYRALTGKKKGAAVDVNTNYRPGTRVPLSEKVAQAVRGALFIPDARVGWLVHGLPAGLKVAREWGADLIFSSSPPYTCALLGRAIARRAKRPWVFELRDPWTGFLSAPVRHGPSRALDRHLEKSCVEQASRVVVAWNGITRDLVGKYPDIDTGHFRLIENGFDPDDLAHVEPVRFDRFTIVYTGSMYGVRNPDTFLKAVAQLLQSGKISPENFRAVFVGRLNCRGRSRKSGTSRMPTACVTPWAPLACSSSSTTWPAARGSCRGRSSSISGPAGRSWPWRRRGMWPT
ncbi:MAG: group 1 glycosyl transferase, partial [bacterium]